MAGESNATYKDVSDYMDDMYAQNIEPSLRSVLRAIGGNTKSTSKHFHDYNKARTAEIVKMASELGSSKLAEILANEIHSLVTARTRKLEESVSRYEKQICEMNEIMDEYEKECEKKVLLIQADTQKQISSLTEKLNKSVSEMEQAKSSREEAEERSKSTLLGAQKDIEAAEKKAEVLVESAQKEAKSLIDSANLRVEKTEAEVSLLRDQVKLLTVDEAKRELEKAELGRIRNELSKTQSEIADLNTLLAQVKTQNESLTIEKDRNYSELQESKIQANKAIELQTQLLGKETQLGELNTKLSQSEKEIESLTRTITLLEFQKEIKSQ